jgi:hypothetical protein
MRSISICPNSMPQLSATTPWVTTFCYISSSLPLGHESFLPDPHYATKTTKRTTTRLPHYTLMTTTATATLLPRKVFYLLPFHSTNKYLPLHHQTLTCLTTTSPCLSHATRWHKIHIPPWHIAIWCHRPHRHHITHWQRLVQQRIPHPHLTSTHYHSTMTTTPPGLF